MTARELNLVSLLIRDYDEAIRFYVDLLGFALSQDTPVHGDGEPPGKRWVVVKPSAGSAAGVLLAKARGAEQVAQIGRQSGGRVFLFMHTDDVWRDYRVLADKGVTFVRGAPREFDYGTVAVFEDLYGNLWDLIEPKQ